jgi:uncharacterized protein YndB with AHSA1/START domain
VLQRLEQRWDRRQEGLEPFVMAASIFIAASPQRVWDFLMAPETAFLTGDGIVNAFRVPGTPVGAVGEQVCVVSEVAGRVRADIIEVVSAEPPSTLVTRWLTSASEVVERATLHPGPGGGTSLTVQLAMRVALGTSKKMRPILQGHLEQSSRRIRSAVESGARLPSIDAAGPH